MPKLRKEHSIHSNTGRKGKQRNLDRRHIHRKTGNAEDINSSYKKKLHL